MRRSRSAASHLLLVALLGAIATTLVHGAAVARQGGRSLLAADPGPQDLSTKLTNLIQAFCR